MVQRLAVGWSVADRLDSSVRRSPPWLASAVVAAFVALFALGWSGALEAKTHPRAIVEETSAEVMRLIEEEAEQIGDDPVKIYETFAPVILPHIDFDRIGARMLGPHWRDADGETRERFMTEFQRTLVRTYAANLQEHEGTAFRVLGSRQRDGEMQVGVEIEGGARGVFHFQERPDAWRVVDITFEGISMVQNYREDFRARLRDKDLKEIIEEMATRNQEIGF
ncbi:hypothetical protein CKO15_02095 [Halorhodospira abdelmalekii]|uniref:MlaC/ttg2D family ABC transporter substrate-binding protein n=1 Tax=Halorhodospira abdelmalekii TaxID=421629 RepID=UPI001902C7F8|nr:ABC transporter substrate-binding protein [Halorhodospira abdelmalekii]MBK1734091.1 hypothetical protein [Halorhodospira abdelmalekii]